MTGDAYTLKGYGSTKTVGRGVRPAIVVVDFQRAFTDPSFPMGGSKHVERAVLATARLLEVARTRRLPVVNVFTAYTSPEAAPRWKIEGINQIKPGDAAAEIDPRVHQPGYDAVFSKPAASAFFGTGVAAYLVKRQVDSVLVTGCVTSGCVRASIVDAFSYGFIVWAVEPCCGDMTEEAHCANLLDVSRRYADVVSLEAAIAFLHACKVEEPS